MNQIDRRRFLCRLGGGAALVTGMGYASASPEGRAPSLSARRIRAKDLPPATARHVVFVLLQGAPSHVDMFDLKLGRWTPDLLGASSVGGLDWPLGILPELGERLDQFSLIRSLSAVEAVHLRAIYHLMTTYRESVALKSEIPHFGSMMSHLMADQRRPEDSLPSVIAVRELVPRGFVEPRHQPLFLNDEARIRFLEPIGMTGEVDRFRAMEMLASNGRSASPALSAHRGFRQEAARMQQDEQLAALLQPESPDEHSFFLQAQAAVRILKADRGARMIQLNFADWDHHINIFESGPEGFPEMARQLDRALAHMLDELGAAPAVGGGQGSLLDQTMIVAVGEFGRTTGPLNSVAGRDHWPHAMPAFVAGGGVAPGRVIGSTDMAGAYIFDRGWSQNREMALNDLTATIYRAMGVDWTGHAATESGRLLDIIQPTRFGPALAIEELFA